MPAKPGTGQDLLHEPPHFVIGERWRPDHRRVVVPEGAPSRLPMSKRRYGSDAISSQISGVHAASNADHAHGAAWLDQISKPTKARRSVHVVQNSHTDHQVERRALERIAQHVTHDVLDGRVRCLALRFVDARPVDVDANHLRRVRDQLAAEQSAPASDIQNSVGGPQPQQQRVVLDVPIPPLLVGHHAGTVRQGGRHQRAPNARSGRRCPANSSAVSCAGHNSASASRGPARDN